MVRRIAKYFFIFVLFALVYLILRESLDPTIFLLGLFFAFLAVVISDRFLLNKKYVNAIDFNFFKFIIFFFYLLYKIISSGIKTAILTLSGNAHHVMLSYKGSLDNDFKRNLLANAITLTPGTITVNREGSDYLILQLNKNKDSGSISDIEQLEKRIQIL